MNNIILQLAEEFTQRILKASAGLTTVGLGQTAEDMLLECKRYAARFTQAALNAASDAIDANKAQRKIDGLSIHEKNVERSQYTALGLVSYRRTYYKDKVNNSMTHLVDRLIGIDRYDRVDAHVSAKIVHEAGIVAYAKSSRLVTNGDISRQTVRNKIMRTCEIAHVPQRSDYTPEEIHIFADEDHVSMQNGKNNNLNLITISEGTRKVSKGRNELISPLHVQGYKIKPDRHWEYVYALCCERYDIDNVSRVYIHGDGAEWIKKGTEHFPDAVHVLDGYHLNASMKKLTSGEICKDYALRLWNVLKSGDSASFEDLITGMVLDMESVNESGIMTKKIRAVRATGAYILSNWEAVQRRLEGNLPGSCTEPIISHVLSERFSRNPMGWSEGGLAQMAMIRVFTQNGNRIEAKHIKVNYEHTGKAPREIGIYKAIVEKQQEEFLSKQWDLSLFEQPSYEMGLVTGTKRAYDSLSKTRYVN